MTAPGCGGADEIREQLAEALYGLMGYTRPWAELEDWRQEKWRCDADALLPTVQALIAKGAAAELRAAAADVQRRCVLNKHEAASVLRDRADALDGTP